MKNIVVLGGSPRKNGNTDMLAQAFIKGALEVGNSVEYISVRDVKVNPCVGCNTCFSREDNSCCQHDDMDTVYRKLKDADVLVIASPVYFYGISVQLKAIVDRLHTPLRNKFHINQMALLLVGAAALPDLFDPILLQYKMVLRFFNIEDLGHVLVPSVKDKGDILKTEALAEAERMGRKV